MNQGQGGGYDQPFGEIAVIATEYTVNSGSYQEAIKSIIPGLKFMTLAPCLSPLWKRELSGPEVESAAGEYLSLADTR